MDFLSVVPPFVAVILAVVTKRVIISLFLSVLVGALIHAGGNPAVAVGTTFTWMKDVMREDTLEGSTTDLVMTPEEAGRKIAELTAPNTPYWDKSHPQHQIDVDEVLRLREHQFPDTLQG